MFFFMSSKERQFVSCAIVDRERFLEKAIAHFRAEGGEDSEFWQADVQAELDVITSFKERLRFAKG
jgi:hypothetical protein